MNPLQLILDGTKVGDIKTKNPAGINEKRETFDMIFEFILGNKDWHFQKINCAKSKMI